MKTVQSFFPTTTKSKASLHHDHTYKVMRKASTNIQDQGQFSHFDEVDTKVNGNLKTIDYQTNRSQNIFRDNNNCVRNYSIDENVARPIGGLDLFKKMQKNTHLNLMAEQSSKALSKKGSRRNIKDSREKINHNNHLNFMSKAVIASNPSKSVHHVLINSTDVHNQKKQAQPQFKEQIFKQHHQTKLDYNTEHCGSNKCYTRTQTADVNYRSMKSKPSSSSNFVKRCQTAKQYRRQKVDKVSSSSNGFKINNGSRSQSYKYSSSSQSLKGQAQMVNNQHLKWANQQQQRYIDKMAILNEINYNKPMIEKMGGRYFECMLRNRFQEQPQYTNKSPYIYQIKQKLTDTKFISKIKNSRPNLMHRHKMTVKGRNKLIQQQQDRLRDREDNKKWQELNIDESFQM